MLHFLFFIFTRATEIETLSETYHEVTESVHTSDVFCEVKKLYTESENSISIQSSPTFPNLISTTCDTVIATGSECVTECPVSTIVSKCRKVFMKIGDLDLYIGENEWHHEGSDK